MPERTPMPATAAEVTADDLFDALARLTCPTVFLDADRIAPDDSDLPQLTGALTAAVERLAVARTLTTTSDGLNAWTAGYLATVGASGTGCGATRAFDMIAVRQQHTEMLLFGMTAGPPALQMARLAAIAASRLAVVASASVGDRDTDTARAAFDRGFEALQKAMTAARRYQAERDAGR